MRSEMRNPVFSRELAAMRQRGVVLLVALILMVAMSLAGIAMMRTVGTGVAIAGNLAFKETATSVADYGVEQARTWLTGATATALLSDSANLGYYSTWVESFSPLSHTWDDTASKQVTNDDGAGNEVRYVIHRLCKTAGLPANDPTQQCATLTTAGRDSSKGGLSYGQGVLSQAIQPYYRVTARVRGPRNTVSYVQVVMY